MFHKFLKEALAKGTENPPSRPVLALKSAVKRAEKPRPKPRLLSSIFLPLWTIAAVKSRAKGAEKPRPVARPYTTALGQSQKMHRA